MCISKLNFDLYKRWPPTATIHSLVTNRRTSDQTSHAFIQSYRLRKEHCLLCLHVYVSELSRHALKKWNKETPSRLKHSDIFRHGWLCDSLGSSCFTTKLLETGGSGGSRELFNNYVSLLSNHSLPWQVQAAATICRRVSVDACGVKLLPLAGAAVRHYFLSVAVCLFACLLICR